MTSDLKKSVGYAGIGVPTMKVFHADGREVSEEELVKWLEEDKGLMFKMQDGVLVVHEMGWKDLKEKEWVAT